MKNKLQLTMMVVPLCLSMTACQTMPQQQAMNPNSNAPMNQRVGFSARAGEVGFYAMNTTRAIGGLAAESFFTVRDEVGSYMNYRNQYQRGNAMPSQNR